MNKYLVTQLYYTHSRYQNNTFLQCQNEHNKYLECVINNKNCKKLKKVFKKYQKNYNQTQM